VLWLRPRASKEYKNERIQAETVQNAKNEREWNKEKEKGKGRIEGGRRRKVCSLSYM
jgi:hypothetical protein